MKLKCVYDTDTGRDGNSDGRINAKKLPKIYVEPTEDSQMLEIIANGATLNLRAYNGDWYITDNYEFVPRDSGSWHWEFGKSCPTWTGLEGTCTDDCPYRETHIVTVQGDLGVDSGSIPKKVKDDVWLRFMGKTYEAVCPACELSVISAVNFHCSHVIPSADGGPSTVDNLRPLCSGCNLSMGAENMFIWCRKYYPKSRILYDRI